MHKREGERMSNKMYNRAELQPSQNVKAYLLVWHQVRQHSDHWSDFQIKLNFRSSILQSIMFSHILPSVWRSVGTWTPRWSHSGLFTTTSCWGETHWESSSRMEMVREIKGLAMEIWRGKGEKRYSKLVMTSNLSHFSSLIYLCFRAWMIYQFADIISRYIQYQPLCSLISANIKAVFFFKIGRNAWTSEVKMV